jgi:hypothetical protein
MTLSTFKRPSLWPQREIDLRRNYRQRKGEDPAIDHGAISWISVCGLCERLFCSLSFSVQFGCFIGSVTGPDRVVRESFVFG